MKKGITIGAVLFRSLALAACGNSANKSSESNPKSSSLVTAKRKKPLLYLKSRRRRTPKAKLKLVLKASQPLVHQVPRPQLPYH